MAPVENAAATWQGDAWKVDTSDVVTIGAREGEPAYTFGDVAGAARLSDGRIVVADGLGRELRYFSPDGRFVRSAGRAGTGPGEFEAIRWLAECGADSVFVYDFALRRVTVFDPHGDYARSFVPLTSVPGRGPSSLACEPGGNIVVSTRSTDAGKRPVGPHRLTAPVALISREGQVVHDFGEFSGPDRYRHQRSDGPLPLGKNLSIAIFGGRVLVGTADAYEIGVFSPDGAQQGLIRRQTQPVRISRADRDRHVDAELARVGDPNRRRRLAAWYRDLQFPEYFPAFASFRADSEGNLWVEEYLRPGERQPRWAVFNPGGRFLGTLVLPKDFTLLQAGRDFILGRWVDSLGVQYVRRYTLAKPQVRAAGNRPTPPAK